MATPASPLGFSLAAVGLMALLGMLGIDLVMDASGQPESERLTYYRLHALAKETSHPTTLLIPACIMATVLPLLHALVTKRRATDLLALLSTAGLVGAFALVIIPVSQHIVAAPEDAGVGLAKIALVHQAMAVAVVLLVLLVTLSTRAAGPGALGLSCGALGLGFIVGVLVIDLTMDYAPGTVAERAAYYRIHEADKPPSPTAFVVLGGILFCMLVFVYNVFTRRSAIDVLTILLFIGLVSDFVAVMLPARASLVQLPTPGDAAVGLDLLRVHHTAMLPICLVGIGLQVAGARLPKVVNSRKTR